MATLEELTIVVDGDTSGATSSLSNLESTASRSASSTESSLPRVSDGFDTMATRAQGFADPVGGVPDTFRGLSADRKGGGQGTWAAIRGGLDGRRVIKKKIH